MSDTCQLYRGSRSELPCGRRAVFQVFRWPLPYLGGVAGRAGSRTGICRRCLDELVKDGWFHLTEKGWDSRLRAFYDSGILTPPK